MGFLLMLINLLYICLELSKCSVMTIEDRSRIVPQTCTYNQRSLKRSISVQVPAYGEYSTDLVIVMHGASSGEWHKAGLQVR